MLPVRLPRKQRPHKKTAAHPNGWRRKVAFFHQGSGRAATRRITWGQMRGPGSTRPQAEPSKRARHSQSGEKQGKQRHDANGISDKAGVGAFQDFDNLGEHCDLRLLVAILFSHSLPPVKNFMGTFVNLGEHSPRAVLWFPDHRHKIVRFQPTEISFIARS